MKKNKIILTYEEDIKPEDALSHVENVARMGRMSGEKQEVFCYCTTFNDGIVVLADVTYAGTDKFVVRKKR